MVDDGLPPGFDAGGMLLVAAGVGVLLWLMLIGACYVAMRVVDG